MSRSSFHNAVILQFLSVQLQEKSELNTSAPLIQNKLDIDKIVSFQTIPQPNRIAFITLFFDKYTNDICVTLCSLLQFLD